MPVNTLKTMRRKAFIAFLSAALIGVPGFTQLASAAEPASPAGGRAAAAELEKARSLTAAGRLDAAAAAYRRVLMADPASFEAHFELGQICISQQKLDEARKHLASAADLRPDVATVHARLAQVLLVMNELEAGEKELLMAAQLDPREVSVHYNLGRLFEHQGRDAEALKEYLTFLELAPTDSRANNIQSRVALYCENSGDLDGAEHHYKALLERDPTRVSAHFGLANVLYRRTRYEEALPHYQSVIELDPSNAAAFANLGFIFRSKGMLKEAIDHYTRAVDLDPSSVSPRYFLGMLYADTGDDARALAEFQRIVEQEPEHPLVHYAIGKLYVKKGNREAAQREFDLHRKIQAEERKKQTTPTTMDNN